MIESIVSNRIIVSALLAGIFILICIITVICSEKARRQAADLARSFFKWRILVSVSLYLVYSTVIVLVLFSLAIIDITMLADTIALVISWMGFTLFESYKIKGIALFWKQILASTLGFTAFMTAYLNFSSFSVPIEMVLQTALLLLVISHAIATYRKYTSVVSAINILVLIIVCAMLIKSTLTIVEAPEMLLLTFYSILAELLISALLSVFILPFAVLVQLETLMMRLGLLYKNTPLTLKAKCALILGLRFNPKYITHFDGVWQLDIDKDTPKELRRRMKAFRLETKEKLKEEKGRLERIQERTGVAGYDKDGLWLDRRDFDETKKDMKSVYACQCGLKQSKTKQYSEDALLFWGLENKGIVLVVATDGSKYYAWKQTPGKWVFGVGGTEDYWNEWQFDGTNEPQTFPGEGDQRWRNISDDDSSMEWAKEDGRIID